MAVYMIVLAAVRLFGLGPGATVRLAPPDGRAAVLIAPLSTTYFYYLAVFSFGLAGDLAARRSIFPAHLFALPVQTTGKAAPLLGGASAATDAVSLSALF